MEFYNGENITDEDSLIENRRCGNHSPFTIESSGQNLSVVFNSDKSETFKGFRAVWSTEEKGNAIFTYILIFTRVSRAILALFQN